MSDDTFNLVPRGQPGVSRVTLEVDGEQVTVFVRDGKRELLCTCGEPDCEHAAIALSWLGGRKVEADQATTQAVRSSAPPTDAGAPEQPSDLADALDDLVLAVVRGGVQSATSLSVSEGVEQVVARAPKPTPVGLARWLGRLNAALEQHDVGQSARLLGGAVRLIQDLRSGDPGREGKARMVAWLGAAAGTGWPMERVQDRTLMEVGREWLSGLTRDSLERRYLVDLGSGEIFREEDSSGSERLSVGPSPRVLEVGLAEVEPGGVPRRIRVLQYALRAIPAAQDWAKLEALAATRVRDLGNAYAHALRRYPGLAEPFVLFAPKSMSEEARFEPQDSDGERLPLARAEEPQWVAALEGMVADKGATWVAGRLLDAGDTLLLHPSSLGFRGESGPRMQRIT